MIEPTARTLAPRLYAAQQRERQYQTELAYARQTGSMPMHLAVEEIKRSTRQHQLAARNDTQRAWIAVTASIQIAARQFEHIARSVTTATTTFAELAAASRQAQ